ncbi:hypothetical protein BDK51DRAFT_52547 [Blyttiomyces helicus]|uniref:Uncharacterized protein n=1 Tax=Blyttiomyces helicus TaxID=388810 RepID=A0A4P9WQA0_9FUNG|nr:hypothetical protein BDK51DRAFT_52547 [Blyttiomyces helicus]|eukprot:RKO94343.1 hypothetical protein BDK51DRAFT_52547 [Blyttiomyces helicus]
MPPPTAIAPTTYPLTNSPKEPQTRKPPMKPPSLSPAPSTLPGRAVGMFRQHRRSSQSPGGSFVKNPHPVRSGTLHSQPGVPQPLATSPSYAYNLLSANLQHDAPPTPPSTAPTHTPARTPTQPPHPPTNPPPKRQPSIDEPLKHDCAVLKAPTPHPTSNTQNHRSDPVPDEHAPSNWWPLKLQIRFLPSTTIDCSHSSPPPSNAPAESPPSREASPPQPHPARSPL